MNPEDGIRDTIEMPVMAVAAEILVRFDCKAREQVGEFRELLFRKRGKFFRTRNDSVCLPGSSTDPDERLVHVSKRKTKTTGLLMLFYFVFTIVPVGRPSAGWHASCRFSPYGRDWTYRRARIPFLPIEPDGLRRTSARTRARARPVRRWKNHVPRSKKIQTKRAKLPFSFSRT